MAVVVQGFRIASEASFWGSCAPLCTVRVFVQGQRAFLYRACVQLLRPLPRFAWAFPVVVVGSVAVGSEVVEASASSSGRGYASVFPCLALVLVSGRVFSVAGWCCCPA